MLSSGPCLYRLTKISPKAFSLAFNLQARIDITVQFDTFVAISETEGVAQGLACEVSLLTSI